MSEIKIFISDCTPGLCCSAWLWLTVLSYLLVNTLWLGLHDVGTSFWLVGRLEEVEAQLHWYLLGYGQDSKWEEDNFHKLEFSPRHIGPTFLQYRISFDVGMGRIQKLWCGYWPSPNHTLPSCLRFCLGKQCIQNKNQRYLGCNVKG